MSKLRWSSTAVQVRWTTVVKTIGGHLLRYAWSAISDWAWYWNFRYRTEKSGVRHYIGYRKKLLSDIQHPKIHKSAQWLRKQVSWVQTPADVINIFWMSDIGMDSDVDIGTLPISEWQFSVRHIFFRYRNNRCRCRISPILRLMSMPTYGEDSPRWKNVASRD